MVKSVEVVVYLISFLHNDQSLRIQFLDHIFIVDMENTYVKLKLEPYLSIWDSILVSRRFAVGYIVAKVAVHELTVELDSTWLYNLQSLLCPKNDDDIAELLLTHQDTDLSMKDVNEDTALFLTIKPGHTECETSARLPWYKCQHCHRSRTAKTSL